MYWTGYNQHFHILVNSKNKIKVMATDKLAKPLGDRVLLTELEGEASQTAGGIIIPDSAKSEDVKRARVDAVGDEVILPPYHQGVEIKVGGNKYILLRESELLMVIR